MPISAISMDESLAKLEKFKREVMQELEAPPELSVEDQLEIFRKMALIREFDTNVKELWKQNFIYGLAHAYLGAEAVAVGACTALKKGISSPALTAAMAMSSRWAETSRK